MIQTGKLGPCVPKREKQTDARSYKKFFSSPYCNFAETDFVYFWSLYAVSLVYVDEDRSKFPRNVSQNNPQPS